MSVARLRRERVPSLPMMFRFTPRPRVPVTDRTQPPPASQPSTRRSPPRPPAAVHRTRPATRRRTPTRPCRASRRTGPRGLRRTRAASPTARCWRASWMPVAIAPYPPLSPKRVIVPCRHHLAPDAAGLRLVAHLLTAHANHNTHVGVTPPHIRQRQRAHAVVVHPLRGGVPHPPGPGELVLERLQLRPDRPVRVADGAPLYAGRKPLHELLLARLRKLVPLDPRGRPPQFVHHGVPDARGIDVRPLLPNGPQHPRRRLRPRHA